jgi:hypothetical protein
MKKLWPVTSRVICYRCRTNVLPRIVRQSGTSGYVGTQIENIAVFAPVTRERFAYECPECGAPFAADEELRRLNGDPKPSTIRVVALVFLLLFVLLAFMIFRHEMGLLG